MEHVYWTLHLRPGQGWVVTRWSKRGNLWPVPVVEYDRLMKAEANDVLEADSTAVLLGYEYP